jgi:ubiquinone/menaquinone biosynthesis C-methylase UbiE
MVEVARAKAAAAGVPAEFAVGDASAPPWPAGTFDVVLVRHVLWALPDPDAALGRWVGLLKPDAADWCSLKATGGPAAAWPHTRQPNWCYDTGARQP